MERNWFYASFHKLSIRKTIHESEDSPDFVIHNYGMKRYNYYLVAGLGFNKETFRNLVLPNAESINYIEWLEPYENEDYYDYVDRMFAFVDTNAPNKVFIGHSFGGVMVQEFAQRTETYKVFLVSTIKHPKEMSANLTIFRSFPLYRWVNHKLIHNTFGLWGKIHDFKNEEQKQVFLDMVDEMTISYFQWAVDAIVHWPGIKNRKITPIHIHGNNDKTFPFRRIRKPDHVVKGGGHFMVYNRAAEVSGLIAEYLKIKEYEEVEKP